jgi:hypothetical protein
MADSFEVWNDRAAEAGSQVWIGVMLLVPHPSLGSAAFTAMMTILALIVGQAWGISRWDREHGVG